jgi:putative spermidine/putrescine transport system permease protein
VSDDDLRRSGWSHGVLLVVVALIYTFLIGPILIIVLTSFTSNSSTAFPPTGFSFRWYGEFFRSSNFTDAFLFSLKLASLAAIIATVIGFLAAYAIVRFAGRRREAAQSFGLLPAMVPHILISMSILLALNFVPLPGFTPLLAGHVVICLPFTIAGVTTSLDGLDAELESAALTLGASRLRTLWEIVLPMAAPGIVSAVLFAFIVSFGDVDIALFLSGPDMTTLPIEMFSTMQWESTPVIASITTLQVLLIMVLGLVVERLVGMRRLMRF